MSLLDFIGGTVPRTPYQLERDIEDALEGGNARWEEAHNEDGSHKAFPEIEVDEDATIGGRLTTGKARLYANEYEIVPTTTMHDLDQVNGSPIDNQILRFVSGTGSWTLTGIVPISDTAPQLLYIVNASGQTGILAHNTGSVLANRFGSPLGADITLVDGVMAAVLYDPSSGVWRIFGIGVSAVKSIQRGTIVIGNGVSTNTATITAVVTAKSEVRFLGVSCDQATADHHARVALTNSTTVTATRTTTTDATTVGYEVTEHY
jgi:hypothetical protein